MIPNAYSYTLIILIIVRSSNLNVSAISLHTIHFTSFISAFLSIHCDEGKPPTPSSLTITYDAGGTNITSLLAKEPHQILFCDIIAEISNV